MEKLFDLSEIVANSPLAAIPLLFQAGQIPDELLPKTAEDRAAISALQSSIWPINDFLASNTRRLKQRLPMQILCLSLAEQILPFIRRAYRKAVATRLVCAESRTLSYAPWHRSSISNCKLRIPNTEKLRVFTRF